MSSFVFCRGCGKQIHETANTCPQCGAPQAPPAPTTFQGHPVAAMDFKSAIKICLTKYVTWKGRASRSEYWYFQLFNFGLSMICAVLQNIGPNAKVVFGVLSIVIALGLLLPGLSVLVRRLHDLGKSGWWFWLLLIPVVGWVILLVWFCSKGTTGHNHYGPDSLAYPQPVAVRG